MKLRYAGLMLVLLAGSLFAATSGCVYRDHDHGRGRGWRHRDDRGGDRRDWHGRRDDDR